MVRPLRTADLKTLLKAPQTAAYQVWSIEHDSGGSARSQSLFFDQAPGTASAARTIPNDTYDPRTRAWYTSARSDRDQITTEPYVFFSTHNVGTTLARRSGDKAVIGADLTLAELSRDPGQTRRHPQYRNRVVRRRRQCHRLPRQQPTDCRRPAARAWPRRRT